MKNFPILCLTNLNQLCKAAMFIALAALPLSGYAIPFSSDVVITGSTDFDSGFSFGPTTGDFGVTEGGTTTLSTYAGSTVTGTDPLSGTFTDISDGLGFSGSAAVTDDKFGIGIDTVIAITNTSAIDTYNVVFELMYRNLVNADGEDAVVDSELTLDIDSTEVFFSDLVSDSLNGDEVGGVETGGFGASILDEDTLLYTILLAPSATSTLDLSWTVEDFSGDYTADGLAELDTSLFLSVASVSKLTTPPPPNVPEPGTLLLLSAGLLGLSRARRSFVKKSV